jgi:hypothetical protein
MFNPDQKAENLRSKLTKDKKYLLAKIGGAKQDPGERKVLDEFFRYKDYIEIQSGLG